MTTRQFDPVLSAALRNELEALADAPAPQEAKGLLPVLRRPQVWISIVTAAVLVAATVGVLQITHPTESQPAGRSKVVDPLVPITDPTNGAYVARQVVTLLHVGATGPGAHDFSVPAGVTGLQIYLNCAPTGHSAVGIDGDGKLSGDCSRNSGSSYGMAIAAGTHEVDVTVPKGTEYKLLLTAMTPPTVSTGALIDPLTEVRNLRNPDALTGDTKPLLRLASSDGSDRSFTATPGQRLRVFLVCRTASATTQARIGSHLVVGCMNSIAHWFDFTPSAGTIDAAVTTTDGSPWRLLVVRAPAGAKDSPANSLLPLPAVDAGQKVLAQVRGIGNRVSGELRRGTNAIDISVTCRGTGWLEIATDEGTIGRGSECDTGGRFATGIGGGASGRGELAPYSVTPHGDITWTATLTDAG